MVVNYHANFQGITKQDDYGIRNLKTVPDVVFDIGANVGVFAITASVLFPEARVIAVEPHPVNFGVLKQATEFFPTITCLRYALGAGKVWSSSLLSNEVETLGFNTEAIFGDCAPIERIVDVPTIDLETLAREYPGSNALYKIDVEGAEAAFITGAMSDAPLRKALYITMELHSLVSGCYPSQVSSWLLKFERTYINQRSPKDPRILQLTRKC